VADELDEYLDRPRSDGAVEWQRRRAGRRTLTENDTQMDYAAIVFPPPDAVRHAALVVCSHMIDEEDPVTAAREVLEALAIPKILRDGGDGRTTRVQNRSLRGNREPLPIGYGPEDYGRPDAKESRKRKPDDAAL
jgi:hypothetical protein